MKKINWIVGALAFIMGTTSCNQAPAQFERTPETEALLANLKQIPSTGIMYGHHDDPLYGIGWEGDPGRSDVKSVCGDYPAVMSFDVGHIELGKKQSLDNIDFDIIRNEIIAQYERGGLNTISWHLDNPLTGGDSWDNNDSTVVASVLPGGVNHVMFMQWVDNLSDYLNSLQTADGTKVPVIFRPWHEHTGSWFWWGQDLCSDQEYKDLWLMTYDRLKQNGVNNLLFAYSPGIEPTTAEEYLMRYPGNDVVDILGFDAYEYTREQYLESMSRSLRILDEVGKANDKIIAVTETGFEAIPDSTWWTETLYPLIESYPLAFVVTWRNAREIDNHYYAPYPGQVSADNFVEYYNNPRNLFLTDISGKLYN